MANYRTDPVLQQSATGTLHRLQTTLSANKSLHNVPLAEEKATARCLDQVEAALIKMGKLDEKATSYNAALQTTEIYGLHADDTLAD